MVSFECDRSRGEYASVLTGSFGCDLSRRVCTGSDLCRKLECVQVPICAEECVCTTGSDLSRRVSTTGSDLSRRVSTTGSDLSRRVSTTGSDPSTAFHRSCTKEAVSIDTHSPRQSLFTGLDYSGLTSDPLQTLESQLGATLMQE